jgi:hypothetical protein
VSAGWLQLASGSPGGIVVAEADEVLHPQLAHVAERHRRPWNGVAGCRSQRDLISVLVARSLSKDFRGP